MFIRSHHRSFFFLIAETAMVIIASLVMCTAIQAATPADLGKIVAMVYQDIPGATHGHAVGRVNKVDSIIFETGDITYSIYHVVPLDTSQPAVVAFNVINRNAGQEDEMIFICQLDGTIMAGIDRNRSGNNFSSGDPASFRMIRIPYWKEQLDAAVKTAFNYKKHAESSAR